MDRTLVAAQRKKLLRRGRALLRSAQGPASRPERLAGLGEPDLAELREIHSALERIERGIFGRCDGCSGAVEVERIELVPWERLCAACEAQLPAVSCELAGLASPPTTPADG
jgi:hypothetical protein